MHWWWGWLAGYGYRARRIAGLLLITLFLAAGLSVWAGHVITAPGHHAAERTATFAEPSGQQCSMIELVGVGLDRGLPLASTGVRTRCDVNSDTGIGEAFTASLWALQAFAWLLATLAFAAYTSLIRKSA